MEACVETRTLEIMREDVQGMRNGRGITLRLMGEEGETKRAKSRKEIRLIQMRVGGFGKAPGKRNIRNSHSGHSGCPYRAGLERG